jgi:RNA polymerase sigma factor (sigma-70 family)
VISDVDTGDDAMLADTTDTAGGVTSSASDDHPDDRTAARSDATHPIQSPRSAPDAARAGRTASDHPGVGDLVIKAANAFADYRDGVPGAIDRLVRLVTPLLWHTARHCGLGAAEAEDAVQQAFLTLVRRADAIADPMAVVRWLTVTLRRQAWRDRAAAGQRSPAEPTDDDLPLAPSAEAVALLSDEQRTLWAHVKALSPRCRRLIAVIAFSPRPDYAAIAADLGMPIGSIGPTRGRCLAKLRARLEGKESS